VHVVHSGISSDFSPVPSESASEVSSRHGLRGPYILYVGTRERRKNLLGLVHAFARVAEHHAELDLVLIGARPDVEARAVQGAGGWTGRELEEAIETLGLARRVRALGMVPRRDLPALYSAASLFAFPTLYEGFGFPALEAMACGTPVVASNLSAIPEVLSGAALLADPTDPDAFGLAMLAVLEDDTLKEGLRGRGLERARAFTWARAAGETLRVYRQVAGR
jgi:glycosyltransferase involved in cell wall biosynthesis